MQPCMHKLVALIVLLWRGGSLKIFYALKQMKKKKAKKQKKSVSVYNTIFSCKDKNSSIGYQKKKKKIMGIL